MRLVANHLFVWLESVFRVGPIVPALANFADQVTLMVKELEACKTMIVSVIVVFFLHEDTDPVQIVAVRNFVLNTSICSSPKG